MPASIQIDDHRTAIIRIGDNHNSVGDEYRVSLFCPIRGNIAEVCGADRPLKPSEAEELRNILRDQAGVRYIVFRRREGRGVRYRIVDTQTGVKRWLRPSQIPHLQINPKTKRNALKCLLDRVRVAILVRIFTSITR